LRADQAGDVRLRLRQQLVEQLPPEKTGDAGQQDCCVPLVIGIGRDGHGDPSFGPLAACRGHHTSLLAAMQGAIRSRVMGEELTLVSVSGREVPITNPDKVFFDERGETKLDLVHYYQAVEE